MKVKKVFDEDWDVSEDDFISENELKAGQEIFDFLQSLIDDELNEEFISQNSLEYHFDKHCLGEGNRKSTRDNIYYDFTNIGQYRNYENEISNKVLLTKNIIYSIYDIESVNKNFRKLFEGNTSIFLPSSCELRNNEGFVKLGFNSFANNVTKNYPKNTINLIVFSLSNKTITMYPLDVHRVQSKLNQILK